MLGVERLGRALVVGRFEQLRVVDVAARRVISQSVPRAPDDDDLLERAEVAHRLVDLLP